MIWFPFCNNRLYFVEFFEVVINFKAKDITPSIVNTVGGGWRRAWSENNVTPRIIELGSDGK